MENIIKYLNLSFTKNIGYKTVKKILDTVGSIENIWENLDTLKENFTERTLNKILNALEKPYNETLKTLELAEKQNVKLISLEDPEYPQNLREISDPPLVLYIKGSLLNLEKSISIVGTRKPSSYGKVVAKAITEFLVENKIKTVSGGALGIDSIVHKTTLDKNGKTVVVLGSGIDVLYPYSNRWMFHKILDNGGSIISEFPFGTKPSKFTFPQRNRIVASLSVATIVIEAPKKSGSLITANLANQYGKIVFSVPHNINNPKGEGCNKLIKDGASVITSLEDIIQEIPYLFVGNEKSFESSLSSIEEKVLDAIDGPSSLDEIIQKTSLSVEEVLEILTILEVEGYIINHNGIYEKQKL